MVSASACSVFSIPITNVSLDHELIARGLQASVGTPPQQLSFIPLWPNNNSFVYTNGLCSGQSGPSCEVFRGGEFNPVVSNSLGTNVSDVPPEHNAWPGLNFHNSDTIDLNGSATLPNFPIGTPIFEDPGLQHYNPMNAFGLGTGSSILTALQSAKYIASRSWSMYWGLQGASNENQVDGVFVFGGYDKAKVTGQNYTMPLDSSGICPSAMLLTIEDLVLEFPNGTTASLLAAPSQDSQATIEPAPFDACLEPNAAVLMSLPLDPYFWNFIDATGLNQSMYNDSVVNPNPGNSEWGRNLGINYYTMVYTLASQAYDGDMIIKIKLGPEVRIYNHQLVVPQRTISSSGTIVANGSSANLPINVLQGVNENDIPYLGRIFLSSAYVMVNQDADTFTLWQSNPTINQDLVAVDEANEVTSCSSMPLPIHTTTSHDSSSISGGAIAGIAIGGAVVVVLLGALAWFLVWRRRRANQPAEAPSYTPIETAVMDAKHARPESIPPQEVMATMDPVELPGHEGHMR